MCWDIYSNFIKMNFILIICLVGVVSANKKPECEGKQVGHVFNRMDVLEEGLNRPYQLSYYGEKHEIFFSHNVGNITEDKFEIRRLHVSSSDITNEKVKDVKNGFAISIDNENHKAYFGGSDGVHEYDLEEDKIKKIIDNHDIWDMFFCKHLYFITFPGQRLYKYTGVKIKGSKNLEWRAVRENWIREKIFQFAIDKDEDVFFTNHTGLFMIKNGTQHRHNIIGETVFRCIEVNNKGKAYFCGKNAIFVVNKYSLVLEEIVDVKNIFGLTFDPTGLIIYSTPTKIVKLTPSTCKILKGVVTYHTIPEVIPNPAKT